MTAAFLTTSILTPNETLTGTPAQQADMRERLTRFRTDPAASLSLAERYPTLTFTTLDAIAPTLDGADVFAAGIDMAHQRFASLGLFQPLPLVRVFIGVNSTTSLHGGYHCPNPDPQGTPPGYRYVQAVSITTTYGDLHTQPRSAASGLPGIDALRAYVHDSLHWGTFRSYRLGMGDGGFGIHRIQHGINFRREDGRTYSARDAHGATTTRNLGVIMEAAIDREATAITRRAARAVGLVAPASGIDRYAFQDATGEGEQAPDGSGPWLQAMNGYGASVTTPYAGFLAEIGGSEQQDLHELIIRATVIGDLEPLQRWLNRRYGPGEFEALFRSDVYTR